MNLEKDFVCDYALKIFVETRTCSEIFFPVTRILLCKDKNVLIRQMLHTITCSIVKAQTADLKVVRMVFEDLPAIIKSLEDFADDSSLKETVNNYYEDFVEVFQLLAVESQQESITVSSALEDLKLNTVSLVQTFRKQLAPPFVQKVFLEYQNKLKRLGDQNNSSDKSDDESEMDDIEISDIKTKESHLRNLNFSESTSDQSQSFSESTSSSKAPKISCDTGRIHETMDHEIDCKSLEEETSSNLQTSASEHSLPLGSDVSNSLESPGSCNLLERNESEFSEVVEELNSINSSSCMQSPQRNIEPIGKPESNSTVSVDPIEIENDQKKKKRHAFGLESDAMLIHGVKKYGTSKWKTIHSSYDFPSFRKPIHLKDRWRTLIDNNIVKLNSGKVTILGENQAKAFKDYSKRDLLLSESPILRKRLKSTSSSPVGTRENRKASSQKQSLESSRDSSPDLNEDEENVIDDLVSDKENNNQLLEATASPRPSNEEIPAEDKKKSTPYTEYKPKYKKKRRLWECDGEALTWDSPNLVEPISTRSNISIPKKSFGKRHRKKPWNEWEVLNLIKGIRRFGVGQWAMILDQYKFANRNSVMLKDKYRKGFLSNVINHTPLTCRNMLRKRELPKDLLP